MSGDLSMPTHVWQAATHLEPDSASSRNLGPSGQVAAKSEFFGLISWPCVEPHLEPSIHVKKIGTEIVSQGMGGGMRPAVPE